MCTGGARAVDHDRLLAEPSEDPAERAAEHETFAEVEAALLQLPEVYQPVVRLHVMHGLDAGAIAASLQRPGGTVRTQLMRGLLKLRQLLPIGVAGVLAGLLPAAGFTAVREVVVAAAAKGAAGYGLALARPRVLGLALLGIAVLTMLAWGLWPNTAVVPTVVVASIAPPAVVPAMATATSPAGVAAQSRREVVAAAPVDAMFELRGVVTGVVLASDGKPAPPAEVLVWRGTERPTTKGDRFEPAPIATTTAAADGTFTISGTGASCYLLARTADAISEHAITGQLDGREHIEGLELRLIPVIEQRGRLVDPDGRGVANFAFGTHRGSSSSQRDKLSIAGFARRELPYLDTRTDGVGNFVVRAAADCVWLWEVQHPEHPMLRVHHRPADGSLTLQLERGATIRGVAWLANGAPAVGAAVILADYPRRQTTCDATGHFTLRGAWLREGLWLQVDHPEAAICCLPVLDADTMLEARLEPARVLAGRLLDADGHALADRELRLVGDRMIDTGANYIGETSTWEYAVGQSRATTNASGAFRFERLYAGEFAIELRSAGGDFFQPLARVRSGAESLQLRAVEQAVVLTACLRDALTATPIEAAKVTVWRRDATPSSWSGKTRELTGPGGSFLIHGVPVGDVRFTFHAAGYANFTLVERDYAPGSFTVDIAMHPVRSLAVEVRGGKQAIVNAAVGAHVGDGVWLMLPTYGGQTNSRTELVGGKALLEGLPARLVTIVLERKGEEPIAQTMDLTRAAVAPMVFDLASQPQLPELDFAVLLFTCSKDADPASWAGRVDREWYRRLQQNAAVTPLTVQARLSLVNENGRALATARVEPVPPPASEPVGTRSFHSAVDYADGTGLTVPSSPEAGVQLRVRGHAVVLHVEAEGMLPVTRRIEVSEIAGEMPAIAVFLRPR